MLNLDMGLGVFMGLDFTDFNNHFHICLNIISVDYVNIALL